jgi:hypothetical protein
VDVLKRNYPETPGYTMLTSKQQVCFPFLRKFAFHKLAQMTEQVERVEFGAKKESL